MRSLVLFCAFAFGQVAANIRCGSRKRFLAVEESRPKVHVLADEEVELLCRPSIDVGCHWIRDGVKLGDGCTIITTGKGHYQCMHGEEIIGSVRLATESDHYIWEWQYGRRHRYDYPSTVNYPTKLYYLCPGDGLILDRRYLCDGEPQCDDGEDEADCFLPCGTPTDFENGRLAQVSELYPHGASVTYTCDRGFVFRKMFNTFRRTCSNGQWSGRPSICERNAAFGGETTVQGVALSSPQLAVDGRTETWTLLTPIDQEQSLTVKLETNSSVTGVLVWMSNDRFGVSVRKQDLVHDCPCVRSVSDSPELTGVFHCECLGNTTGFTEVTVRSRGSIELLSVAEIAVLEQPSTIDECAQLDRPVHGRFERHGDSEVKLVCEAGYQATCGGVLPCREAAGAQCRPIVCPLPPVVPNTVVHFSNGTGWSAVNQYACATGHQLFPADQRTEAVCGDDGQWSISHVFCLPVMDVRVVASRLNEQHALHMAELRKEVAEMSVRLARMQLRVRLLEDELGLYSNRDESEETTSETKVEVEAEALETAADEEEVEPDLS